MRRFSMVCLLVLFTGILSHPADAQEPVSPPPVQLAGDAQPGQVVLIVTDAAKLLPKRPILLRSGEGQAEIHYISAFDRDHVTLSSGVRNSYPNGSAVIQDPTQVRLAVSQGVPVIGEPSGVSAGVFPLISPFRPR